MFLRRPGPGYCPSNRYAKPGSQCTPQKSQFGRREIATLCAKPDGLSFGDMGGQRGVIMAKLIPTACQGPQDPPKNWQPGKRVLLNNCSAQQRDPRRGFE